MDRTIHLAIIDADIPARGLYEARGLYSSQFERVLQTGVAQLNQTEQYRSYKVGLRVTAYDLVGGVYPPFELLRSYHRQFPNSVHSPRGKPEPRKANKIAELNQPIDAILITGAAAGAYETDKYPWILELEGYIKRVYAEYPHVRILGSCFGHQLIAQALFSKEDRVVVEKSPLGREAGLYTIQLDSEFTEYFPIVSGLHHGLSIQMMHADWVTVKPRPGTSENASIRLPRPWVNIGRTDICPIQGLYNPGRILTIQGHFELDAFALSRTCIEFAPLLGWSQEFLDTVMGQIGDAPHYKDDADMVAKVVVLFLAGIESGAKLNGTS
ncbi:class I glutamine amidotransferase-like protein [Aspergillus alliaceus]|uniref:Class I glutamine amidotransferase-like protein n=1 Tax=Petromyces alliaceus TaxID=209559 RepID=A0A5N7BWH0_PETAA|nr:class I glutamine amidotransferase-like protein [Aspergillus alliaceus]